MIKNAISALVGTSLLLSVANAQAADVVLADCTASNTSARLTMNDQGVGTLKASISGEEFSCGLQLKVLEGPPFSESMTGMLVLTFDRAACDNKAAKRRIMRDISLHIEEPLGTASSGMTMVQRRPVMYQCKVDGFNLKAVRNLVQSKAIQVHSEN